MLGNCSVITRYKAVGIDRRVDVVSRKCRDRHYQRLGLTETDRDGMASPGSCVRSVEEFALHGIIGRSYFKGWSGQGKPSVAIAVCDRKDRVVMASQEHD